MGLAESCWICNIFQMIHRNGAIYQPGAIAVRVNTCSEAQSGELLDNMWDLTNVARFKLLDSRTGDAFSSAADVVKGEPSTAIRMSDFSCSMKRKIDSITDSPYVAESWNPKDIMIIDEGRRPIVLGKVIKVRI